MQRATSAAAAGGTGIMLVEALTVAIETRARREYHTLDPQLRTHSRGTWVMPAVGFPELAAPLCS